MHAAVLCVRCWVHLDAEDSLLSAQGQGIVDAQSGLTKVVLARRSDIAFRGHLDPLLLLAALQVRKFF